MKTTLAIILITIIAIASVIGVSATVSHTTHSNTDINNTAYTLCFNNTEKAHHNFDVTQTHTNTDHYSDSEWNLTFAN